MEDLGTSVLNLPESPLPELEILMEDSGTSGLSFPRNPPEVELLMEDCAGDSACVCVCAEIIFVSPGYHLVQYTVVTIGNPKVTVFTDLVTQGCCFFTLLHLFHISHVILNLCYEHVGSFVLIFLHTMHPLKMEAGMCIFISICLT